MMKQKKVKKELVLVTYWDYLKHFGREEGRKKWREYKDKITISAVAYEQMFGKEKVPEPVTKVEEVRVEEISLEKAKGDIRYRADKIRETLLTIGWKEYIKPRMQACIDLYKSVYDDVPSYEELKVNQAVRKELRAILQDIDGWIVAELELNKEEEDATNVVGKKGIESDGSPAWQSER